MSTVIYLTPHEYYVFFFIHFITNVVKIVSTNNTYCKCKVRINPNETYMYNKKRHQSLVKSKRNNFYLFIYKYIFIAHQDLHYLHIYHSMRIIIFNVTHIMYGRPRHMLQDENYTGLCILIITLIKILNYKSYITSNLYTNIHRFMRTIAGTSNHDQPKDNSLLGCSYESHNRPLSPFYSKFYEQNYSAKKCKRALTSLHPL